MAMLLSLLIVTVLMLIFIPNLVAIIQGAPFVPTPMRAVKHVLKAASIKKGERVYDIGCGDGRFVHFANKLYKADSVGIELDPSVWFLAQIRKFFWKSKAKIVLGDFRNYSLTNADKIVCYMMPNTLAKFRTKFAKEMRKGSRVISYAFHIEGWKPIRTIPRNKELGISPIWIYEVGKS